MILLQTADPKGLLESIYNGIAQKPGTKGSIITWLRDKDGNLRHASDSENEWEEKAWFQPIFPPNTTDVLKFTISWPEGTKASKETQDVFAVYHGRFLQMMMMHFSNEFTITQVTVKPPATAAKA